MRTILLAALLAALPAAAHAQGFILLDNSGTTTSSPTATSDGLFWLQTGGNPVLINQDFNAAFYTRDRRQQPVLARHVLAQRRHGQR